MNNPVVKTILRYWWISLSCISLVLLLVLARQKNELLSLQDKVVGKTLKVRLLFEKSLSVRGEEVETEGMLPSPISFCSSDHDRGFILVFYNGNYSIGILESRNLSNLPRSRSEFIKEEGRVERRGNSIFLKQRRDNGDLGLVKEIVVAKNTSDSRKIKHLSFYGEVLSESACFEFEEDLAEKYITGYIRSSD